ncbi:hypothetical protein [Streptosporangium sp. NPDC000396]|uniref:hypothetical protein n=1 Tax=Streptosporangium sp. NPDC000396 TaxID=3366185 RepID=UPI00369C218D
MVATLSQIVRLAPDGSRLDIALPSEAGSLAWHGHTRLGGPSLVRNFSFAQAGQHRVIPSKIFPGGRTEVFRQNGYDLVLYEAADRSQSCLVWAGPHNEVTTWFGGAAPRRAVLNHTVSAVSFTDSPEGARLVPAVPAMSLQQFGTVVIGRSDDLIVMIKDARAAREELPEHRGAVQGDTEMWKEKLELDGEQAAQLAGTPYEWRYIYANPTSIAEIIFPMSPDAARARVASDDARVDSVLSGLRVTWAA